MDATLLVHPLPDSPIAIYMDTSDVALGTVHEQLFNVVNQWWFITWSVMVTFISSVTALTPF